MRGEEAGVGGQTRCRAGAPRPTVVAALTRTMANRSSSSPGSGIGSFKGTLCALKSVCCESMLPALPMLAARGGRGLLRAPRVCVGNQNSFQRLAPTRWLGRPARLSAFRCAQATVQSAPLPSSAPSRAAPRPPSCSPPLQRRSGLFSSGGVVRALSAYLHVAPLPHRSLPVIQDSGCLAV